MFSRYPKFKNNFSSCVNFKLKIYSSFIFSSLTEGIALLLDVVVRIVHNFKFFWNFIGLVNVYY